MAAEDFSSDIRLLVQAIGAQTEAIGNLARSIGDSHLDHEARLRKLEEIATILKERMSIWQLGQAGYTTVAAAIAATIGLLRK